METSGAFKFEYKNYDVFQFSPDQLEGRVPDTQFQKQLIAAGLVINPIITTSWLGQEYLIGGRRRILNCQELARKSDDEIQELFGKPTSVTGSDFAYITGKCFQDISPADQATWSLILNEQTDENLIHTWLTVKSLQDQGKWDEIVNLHRLNKQRFNRIAQLDDLKNPDIWIDAYTAGKVSEATILQVAKLGARQIFCEQLLAVNGKFTGKNVVEAKQVTVKAALATLPNLPAVSQNKPPSSFFIVYDPIANQVDGVSTEIASALARKNELGGNWKLYQMREI